MLSLSIWAKKHPWPSRVFIAVAHVFLAWFGLEGGYWLYAGGIELPSVVFYLLLGGFSLAYLGYPFVRRGSLEGLLQFRRRKLLDTVLFGCVALMWLVAGNRLPQSMPGPVSGQEACVPLRPVTLGMLQASPEAREQAGLTKVYRWAKTAATWLSRHHKNQFYGFKQNDDASIAGIIVLGVLLTLIIGFLTAAFACGLACAGNEAIAVLVAVFGAGLIAGLWILFVHWMRRVRGVGNAAHLPAT